MERIIFGADKQNSVSYAMANPNVKCWFFAKTRIIDGHDLPNVRVITNLSRLPKNVDCYLFNLEYSQEYFKFTGKEVISTLLNSMKQLHDLYPENVLEVSKKISDYPCIIKGNVFHNRDSVIKLSSLVDYQNYKLKENHLFQKLIPDVLETVHVVGYRSSNNVSVGAFKILNESHAYINPVLAAESVSEKDMVNISLKMLDQLNFEGYFKLNWIKTNSNSYLTSFRAEPHSFYGAFKASGIKENSVGTEIVKPGLKILFEINYSSYQ